MADNSNGKVDVKSDKLGEKIESSPVAKSFLPSSISSTPSTSSAVKLLSVSESKHIYTESRAKFPLVRSSQSSELHVLDQHIRHGLPLRCSSHSRLYNQPKHILPVLKLNTRRHRWRHLRLST